ncbi:MAG: diacylglycerol/lipid kinase family protein [Allosphingosinicella sp.]|uniref:diacylglycerol/lipid kinase family protein n=1 Tax=Allosphingosinicella sp. TaxID=2823234 RepID=UPI0039334163
MSPDRPVPRQAVLIVNAHSRRGRELFRQAVEKLRAAGVDLLESYAIRNPEKLIPKVKEVVKSGAPMVIVGGGDGSLSCAVDELVDRDCVFALLPLGTANSFARTLGIPVDLDGAVATIANGKRRRVDLGVIDGDYFANSAAIGLSPLVGATVPHKWKKWFGRAGYLSWALYQMVRFRPFGVTIEADGERHSLTALEVRIANGGFHGGVVVVDEAEVDSGDIVVQVVTGREKRRLAWNWIGVLLRLRSRRETVRDFRGSRLRIETRPPLPISIDGEVTGRTPATVEVARCAIEVVVPA